MLGDDHVGVDVDDIEGSGDTVQGFKFFHGPVLSVCVWQINAKAFPGADHQVQILHGGTGGALAEIVIDRGEQDLAPRLIAKNLESHAVGIVEGLGIDRHCALNVLKWRDFNESTVGIGRFKNFLNIRQTGFFLEQVQEHRNCAQHALRIIADNGRGNVNR